MQPAIVRLWVVAVAASLAFFLAPWKFGILGYRFPYHGVPALALAASAAAVGAQALARGRRGLPSLNAWLLAGGLGLAAAGFQVAFILGPETVTARGQTIGPWGTSPLEFQITVSPQWGAYGAAGAALTGAVAAFSLGVMGRRRA